MINQFWNHCTEGLQIMQVPYENHLTIRLFADRDSPKLVRATAN